MTEAPKTGYDFPAIERHWQSEWERTQPYRAVDGDPRPKYYVLEMFPYPSGDLHVGHAKNYTLGDTVARLMRMRGYNVLHPMGFDAFGLPAENAAIERGIDPNAWTLDNIANMERQIRLMGTGYDWNREIATCLPDYYRWNQWLFTRMFADGLAYKREAPVNWCPKDQTVLANEQVVDGRCWRCDTVVERRNLSQWFFKITAYADRLLEGIDTLAGWPEKVKTMQRNWIGRSEGTTFSFEVDGIGDRISVYTTRVDTLFGVTFLALAPEHPIVAAILERHPAGREAVERFAASVRDKSELERTSLMAKSGVPTGAFARNPVSGERIPIWVTNYVLADYGTGAVMGVPAHDERDFDFARAHGLPIVEVVEDPSRGHTLELTEAFVDDGRLLASGDFSGMDSARARDAITQRLIELGIGKKTINYRVRDWLISRQRYWGTPIPIVHCPVHGAVAVPDDQLPVRLPADAPLDGEGSPLARVPEFVNTACPVCGGPAVRDTDTMDTFFDSSWYYARFCDPHNEAVPFDEARAGSWLNVDQYVGGTEHAVLHLLYARFFYKYFKDKGWISGRDEPFERLFNQGMVWRFGEKMSKSRGNTIAIDETAERYGIDAMRTFLLKATPPEDTMEWSDEGISGRVRFLDRVWRVCEPLLGRARTAASGGLPATSASGDREIVRAVHATLKSAADEVDTQRFHFNTTLARLDELINAMSRAAQSPGAESNAALLYGVAMLPLLLAPFAPHIAEELWHRMGHAGSVHLERMPEVNPAALTVDEVTVVVQVNGKIRGRFPVPPGTGEEQIAELAFADPNVAAHLHGKTIRKQVYVPDRLLSLVV
jgi:leucyl-tRNA synthetase